MVRFNRGFARSDGSLESRDPVFDPVLPDPAPPTELAKLLVVAEQIRDAVVGLRGDLPGMSLLGVLEGVREVLADSTAVNIALRQTLEEVCGELADARLARSQTSPVSRTG